MATRKFKVPVEGTVCFEYDIEAENHEEAERLARAEFRKDYSGIVFDETHPDAQLVDGDEE